MSTFTRSLLLVCLLFGGVTALAQPTANFTATPIVGCAPLLVNFTSTSTGNPTSWQWNLGNSTNSVLQNPSTTYTIPGTYTVTLTVSNASGSNTKTVTNYITVYGSPIVNFSGVDTAGCPPHFVSFTDASIPSVPGPATYGWSFGDGGIAGTQNPTHTFAAPGYYNITLVVTNSGGCVSSLTKPNYIHVYTPPVADFTAPTFYCDNPAIVDFTTNVTGSGPYTYDWTFGDGNIGTGANPSHTYANQGSFTVKLIVTDVHGCKDTVLKPNYINVGNLVANFNPPASGCVNTPFTFTSTSVGASSFYWDFGDGGTMTTTSTTASYIYTTAGTYNVTLVAINTPCTDTITFPITINPQPDADFAFTPIEPCPPPSPVQFQNLSTGATSYAWTFGDGGTSTQTNPLHTYNNIGYYDVGLIATSSFGCKDTVFKPGFVPIYDLILDAGASPYQGCVPLSVFFSAAQYTNLPSNGALYPYTVGSWFWDFGDGNTSTQDTVTHTYTATGTYHVTLTIVTSNGCTQVDSLQVLVGSLPTASFTAAPDTICNHGSVQFINGSTGATAYIWDFGDGGSTGAISPSHTYTVSGTYTIVLHAYNNGCEDTFMVQNMILVHPPTSIWHAVYSCDTPLKVHFWDTASIEPTSLLWYFGDGGSSTSSNPVHTYPALGTYNVTLITYNSIYGCTDTMTNPVQLINPALSFVTPDTAICRGDSITFTPTYTGSLIGTYTWYINNVYIDTSYNIWGYRYYQNGIYTMRVIAHDLHLCPDTATRNGYILVAKPTAAFTGVPTVGCVPLNVLFTENSTNTPGAYSVTRAWDFGNGNTATVNTASTNNIYNAAGIYDVKMIVTDNVGCSDTLLKPAYIEARKPVAAFTANDTAACIGQNITFNNSSTGAFLTAIWTFGDGGTSNVFSPTHSYAQTGTYTVKVVVTDPSGCKDSLTRTAYINISKPDASFTMSDTLAICPPLNVLFTNTTTGAINYSWILGNTSTSTLQNPSAIYTDPGVYTITMIATNSEGCKDTAYGGANVLGYAGGLSYAPLEGCAPLDVDFTANLTNVPTIIWDFSDGVTAPANGLSTTTHTYLTPGAYIPKLILSDGAGCLNSSQGLDTIRVDGIYAGFITSPACINTPVLFTDTSFSFFSPLVSWYWSFNNGQLTSTSPTPTNIYNAPGSYPVHLIVTNAHGCADTLDKNITIYGLPVISAGLDTSVCSGDAAQLEATGGASYAWTPGGSLSCTNCPNPSASPLAPTSYVVIGTDVHGCENKDTVFVNVQFITTSATGPDGEICDDSTFQLLAYGAQKYEWKPAATLDNKDIPNPVASPHTTTVYTVIAWEGTCPPDSHTVRVVVYPKPLVDAGGDQTIVAGGSVMLNATGSNLTGFLWSPAQTLSCDICSNPTASPVVTTTYKVIATSTHGCKSGDTVTVHVLCDKSQLFIPNLFSPNGDGQNDVFFPRGVGLKEITSFRVYNRWGELVFEGKNIFLNEQSTGWDGTYKGAQLSPDVFVYVLDGVCDTGEPISWKGDVTLIR